MEDSTKLIEELLERATEYSKTTYELVRLKTLDKTADVVSSFIPHSVVFVLIASFMLFFNLGLAFWLGKIIGSIFYGFFVVAAFYGIVAVIFHFLIHNKLKKSIHNFIIQQMLK